MSGELIPADRAAEIGWADIFAEKKQGVAEAEKLIEFISAEGGFTPEKAGEFMLRYKKSKGE